MSGWRFDERTHAGPEHLDPAYVAGYDAKSGVDTAAEIALLRANGLHSDATLVDLGAGTGRLAVAAASQCRRVVAVDPSPAMLAAARERANAAGQHNIDFVAAGTSSTVEFASDIRPFGGINAGAAIDKVRLERLL